MFDREHYQREMERTSQSGKKKWKNKKCPRCELGQRRGVCIWEDTQDVLMEESIHQEEYVRLKAGRNRNRRNWLMRNLLFKKFNEVYIGSRRRKEIVPCIVDGIRKAFPYDEGIPNTGFKARQNRYPML